MNCSRLLKILVCTYSLTTFAAEAPPKPNSAESKRSYLALKQHLTKRFHLRSQARSLPSTIIESLDCTIRIEDLSNLGDRIMIVVKQGDHQLSTSTWIGEPATFSANTKGFTHSTWTESCEEAGCDDYWYPSNTLFFGERILRISKTTPYSHKTESINCILE